MSFICSKLKLSNLKSKNEDANLKTKKKHMKTIPLDTELKEETLNKYEVPESHKKDSLELTQKALKGLTPLTSNHNSESGQPREAQTSHAKKRRSINISTTKISQKRLNTERKPNEKGTLRKYRRGSYEITIKNNVS